MAKKLFRPVIRSSSLAYRPELDGLRALAISAVVAAHLGLFNYGPYGVDFFFVLSGFLITDVLLKLRDKKGNLKTFWIGRIARLTPILIVNVLVGSILSYFFLRSTFHISQPLSALFYVKNFFILSRLEHDVWAPTWTLGAEEQFYLVWPIIVLALLKRIRISTLISLAVVYFLAVHELLDFIRYVYNYLNPDGIVSQGLAGKVVQVVIRPSEILLGALITLHRKISGPPIVLYFIGANFAGIFYGLDYSTQIALLSGFLLSLLELKVWPSRILKSMLSFKPLVVLGVLSYSIYLWHTMIFEILFSHIDRSPQVKCLILALTLLVAYTSYVYVELPMQKLIKNRTLNWTKK